MVIPLTWMSILLVIASLFYSFGLMVAAVVLSYKRPPSDWFQECVIGVLSVLWPMVLFCFVVGRCGKLCGLEVIDPIITMLETRTLAHESKTPDSLQ